MSRTPNALQYALYEGLLLTYGSDKNHLVILLHQLNASNGNRDCILILSRTMSKLHLQFPLK